MVSSCHIPRFVVRGPQFVAFGPSAKAEQGTARTNIPLSVWEDEGKVCIEADLPGSRPQDIDVRVEDGSLRISGERVLPQREAQGRHNERRFGAFERVLPLGKTLDPSRIDAELRDGVLSITLYKRPETQTQKVQVKYAGEASPAPDSPAAPQS
ncbi:MAG: Hsp20/alpha crystallin family protein [Planctomycetaceae bacterium]|nr:Hsp20/alpha crystallin family protein [Planctomycetaceae bacterium]